MVSFTTRKFLILMKPSLVLLLLLVVLQALELRNHCLIQGVKVYPCFLLEVFCARLIHFKVIFVHRVRWGQLHSFPVAALGSALRAP